MPDIEADFQRELAEIEAESMGWIPFDEGVYLHVSDENAAEWVFRTNVTEILGHVAEITGHVGPKYPVANFGYQPRQNMVVLVSNKSPTIKRYGVPHNIE